MLPSAILGLGLLFAAIFLMRWYANADPAVIRRVIKWAVISGLGLVALFLALTGRLAAAFGLVMGIVAFGWRLFNMLATFQQMRGMFGSMGGFGGFGTGAQASTGQSSQVEAHFLRMTLEHDSGRMDGEVLTGPFQGRVLSAMSLEDLLQFRVEVQEDSDSVGLLDAYLDRSHVGWREDFSGEDETQSGRGSGSQSGPMTRTEAYRVLGIESDADRKAIKNAYRQLMSKVHPDHGGSAYLAAKINEAKDLLLGN
ncbi:MAG: DnaJ domain-containing protein [Alphaproteobacteria bacterium]|nr:DnaJ domain-containing protein [Alphaproteobacteria bacterium]